MLCDAAPSYSGQSQLDHIRLMSLAEQAARLSRHLLSPGGWMVLKASRGGEENTLRDSLKSTFSLSWVKPPSSRSESSEMYLVGQKKS